eukprot:scaffold22807_cov19-Tisochrysis_lutea.AAC.3
MHDKALVLNISQSGAQMHRCRDQMCSCFMLLTLSIILQLYDFIGPLFIKQTGYMRREGKSCVSVPACEGTLSGSPIV